MNTHRITPSGLAHQSVRTSVSTNRDAITGEEQQTRLTTELELRWIGGELAVRFQAYSAAVAPQGHAG